MQRRGQPFHFGFADTLLAEAGGAPLDALHRDVDAILDCCDAAVPIAERLGVAPPRPHIAGFSYTHLSTLGAPIVFAQGSEPNVMPILHEPASVDGLKEPDEYLTCGVAPQRIAVMRELRARRPDAAMGLDHAEGPITTAALLTGPDFFVLPYLDPERAHRLLAFVVQSCVNYNRAVAAYFGESSGPRPVGLADDFAGMFAPEIFAEFVVPYWEAYYREQQATTRSLHSELLRKEHLPFLSDLGIAVFDPSADQYVDSELLRAHCPVPFTARIQAWDIRDKSEAELCALYRRVAACEPETISFYIARLEDESKIRALLEVARELE